MRQAAPLRKPERQDRGGNLIPIIEPISDKRALLRDRARTEAALRSAVLELLDENGILAGISLQAVSDRAGVSRGLVYQYFGNRQGLLRAALRDAVAHWVPQVSRRWSATFVDRVVNAFRAGLSDPWMSRLVTLLILDGDAEAQSMPLYATTNASFLRDKAQGTVAEDVDIDAVHVLIGSVMHGYTLHRESFARQIGIPVSSLDERIESLLHRLISSLGSPSE